MKPSTVIAPLLVGLLAGIAAPLAAQQPGVDWKPTLIEHGSSPLAADGALRVLLGADLPPETLPWLALELDGIDVSEIVRLEQGESGPVAAVIPPQRLAAGRHELRLVEYSPQGDIIEKGVWWFDIESAAAAEELAAAQRFFSAQFVLDGAYRVAEGDLDSDADKVFGQGASSLAFESDGEDWQTRADLDLIYDSAGAGAGFASAGAGQPGDPRGGSELELGEYLVSARSQNVAAMVGHHSPAADSLLVQNFNRRGVSLTGNTVGGSLTGSGFAFRTEPVGGFRHGLGVGDDGNRVAGALVSLKPAADGDLLTITGTYIDGAGEDHSGLGVAGDDILPEGDGYSIAVESQFAGRRVKLRAEHATTRYDFDGSGEDFRRREDDAQSFLGLFHLWRDRPVGAHRASWSVGYEQQEIGLFFRSLANPSLPYDRNIRRLFSDYRAGGLSLRLQAAVETDNVDDDPTLPVFNNELGAFALSWSPRPRVDDDGNPVTRWFGEPTFTFSAEYSNQFHDQLPAELRQFAVDRQVTTYQGGAAFRYQRWYWSLNQSLALEKDFGFEGDFEHRLTDLQLLWQPGSWFALGGQAQYNTVEDRLSGIHDRSWLAALDMRAALLEERLQATLNVSLNRDAAGADSRETETRTLGLRLDWLLRRPAENLPGWTLWLQAEMQEVEDSLDPRLDTSPYQVFAGARMDWPVTWTSR